MPVLLQIASSLRGLSRRVFYPDLVRHGGLGQALNAALTEIGSKHRVTPGLDMGEPDWVFGCAYVASGRRECHIFVEEPGRGFLVFCWDRDSVLAKGKTLSLTRLAEAVDRWVGPGCTAAALTSEFPFIDASPAATIYETGAELEYIWEGLIAKAEQRLPRDHSEWRKWDEFVLAAAQRPPLRQLYPLAGTTWFGFSRCTRFPFTCDTPRVWYQGDAGYSVHDPTDQELILGCGDARIAADVVVRYLPPDCGPAVSGTLHDLARQLAERDGISVEEVVRRVRPMGRRS